MKKAKNNSQVATLQDLQEMTNFIVTAMDEMFNQQNKKIDKLSSELGSVKQRVNKLEEGQAKLEKGQAKLEKGQKEQLEISLQVVDELKSMREEQGAQAFANSRVSDTLESHENRISRLEQNFAVI